MPVETPQHEKIRFEPSDISWRPTLIAGICVIVGAWLSAGLLFFYFTALKNYRASFSPSPLPFEAHGDVLPPAPRLQRSDRLDLKAYIERQDWELSHYHWIDKDKSIVAIPIEKAIEIVAQRGLPPTNGAANPTNTPPVDGTRETGFEGKVEPEPR